MSRKLLLFGFEELPTILAAAAAAGRKDVYGAANGGAAGEETAVMV